MFILIRNTLNFNSVICSLAPVSNSQKDYPCGFGGGLPDILYQFDC
jgi:hypothetical protein